MGGGGRGGGCIGIGQGGEERGKGGSILYSFFLLRKRKKIHFFVGCTEISSIPQLAQQRATGISYIASMAFTALVKSNAARDTPLGRLRHAVP